MDQYHNASGSGIQSFKIGKDYIILEFADSERYLYSYKKPGKKHVDSMIDLAKKGSGLNTYINKYVRGNYMEKLTEM